MMKPLIVVAALPVVPMLWLLAQVGSNEPAPVDSPFANMGQVWLAIILLAGNIFTHIMGARREERARAWAVEDRRAADEKAEKQAAQIRADLERKADEIRDEAWRRADSLGRAVAENTRLTTEGIKVSNNVNEKILSVGAVRVALEGQRQVFAPERRPGDSAPETGRRASDPPPITPTRRSEEKEPPAPIEVIVTNPDAVPVKIVDEEEPK